MQPNTGPGTPPTDVGNDQLHTFEAAVDQMAVGRVIGKDVFELENRCARLETEIAELRLDQERGKAAAQGGVAARSLSASTQLKTGVIS